MPPIALPQLSDNLKRLVRYPRQAAGNPPTTADKASAIRLHREVELAFGQPQSATSCYIEDTDFSLARNEASEEEIVRTMVYQTALISSEEGRFAGYIQVLS
jgi:hypothetical protein